MTTLNLPHDIENNTTADAIEPQGNFSTIENYVNSEVIRRDGGTAMAAQLVLVGDPVSDNDAARKAYVDALLPVGVILAYGGTAPPPGMWALCNGATLDSTTYAKLFAVLAYRWGGSGSTFSLPNMVGRMLVMSDPLTEPFTTVGATGGSKDARVPLHDHGLGSHVHGLGSHTHEMAAHTHGVTDHTHNNNHGHGNTLGVGTDSHSHTSSWGGNFVVQGTGNTDGGLQIATGGRQVATTNAYSHSHGLTGGISNYTGNTGTMVSPVNTGGPSTPNTAGPSTPNTEAATGATEVKGDPVLNLNLPPYAVVNYIIKVA